MKALLIRHKIKIIIGVLILLILTGAYCWGGNYAKPDNTAKGNVAAETVIPDETGTDVVATASPEITEPSDLTETDNQSAKPAENQENSSGPAVTKLEPAPAGSSEGVYDGSEEYSTAQGMEIDPETGKDQYQTDPVPEGKPVPVEPQNAVISDTELTCTLSVSCSTILDNMDFLDKEKWELVPEDGVIFAKTEVIFYEGESVFNVLLREMKKAGIHMEYENTPIYNSAYIEGINNLYEFDVGELSGWMYKVNDWFPNYGCSRYQLKDGDVVEWVYTCDLGKDVGGYYSVGGS